MKRYQTIRKDKVYKVLAPYPYEPMELPSGHAAYLEQITNLEKERCKGSMFWSFHYDDVVRMKKEGAEKVLRELHDKYAHWSVIRHERSELDDFCPYVLMIPNCCMSDGPAADVMPRIFYRDFLVVSDEEINDDRLSRQTWRCKPEDKTNTTRDGTERDAVIIMFVVSIVLFLLVYLT